MNTVVYPFKSFPRDVAPAGDQEDPQTGANPVNLDEFIHELRQPLSIIENAAYFIELTTTDENIAPRLEQIQSMLGKVHELLEEASERGLSRPA